MKYKKPSEFKDIQSLWKYMNENNVVIIRGHKEYHFMDADDCYLGGAFDE